MGITRQPDSQIFAACLIVAHTPVAATELLRQISATARAAKIFIYDLGVAGLQPPLDALSANSSTCQSCPPAQYKGGMLIDMCNNAYGKPLTKPFASFFQGTAWSNHDGGFSIAPMVHARLAAGKRAVADPQDASLFFIPLYARQICRADAYTAMAQCGLDFSRYADPGPLWRWLLEQPAFRQSSGSDHFMILSQTLSGFMRRV
jgi:hypothetical protein